MSVALLMSKSVNQSLRYLVKYTPRGNPRLVVSLWQFMQKECQIGLLANNPFFAEKGD